MLSSIRRKTDRRLQWRIPAHGRMVTHIGPDPFPPERLYQALSSRKIGPSTRIGVSSACKQVAP